jgi:hypothetical protein
VPFYRKITMRIAMSERMLTQQIKELEGLDPATSLEEITHNMVRYFRRLAEHIKDYGVTLRPEGFQASGTIATMAAELKPSWSEDDVQTRISGLSMLAPLSVSLDSADLPAFVTNRIMLAGLEENWMAFGQGLQRITLPEVRNALENAAQKLMSVPVAQPTNEFEQEMQDAEYTAFLVAAGRKDPLAKHREIEEFNRAEVERVQAAEQKAHDDFWDRD